MVNLMNKMVTPLLCALSFSLLLSCQQGAGPNQSLSRFTSTQLQGKVTWQTPFKVQATLSEIKPQATVSLLYPSDHPTLAHRTIATGLTDASGEFTINPSETFAPSTGDIFILEASKRIGGPGNPLLSLRTFLRWDGSTWSSITGTSIQLNALTTAIAIMAHNDSSISSLLTIDSAPEGATPDTLGDTSANDIETVRDLVSQTLTENQDPNAFIERDITGYRSKSDVNTLATNSFNGKVYSDLNVTLDEVKVVARSLSSSIYYEAETTTTGGTYVFNNAPAGVQLEIIASYPGYTTRRRVEVINTNTENDANRFDFGTDNSGTSSYGFNVNALSDKPEVILANPGRNSSSVNPSTRFVLQFSEPMDRQTVVDAFQVRVFGTEKQLSVDNEITFSAGLGSNGLLTFSGDLIWNKGAFNASWNDDDTEVILTFKEERTLPTDKTTNNTPDYAISFNAGVADIRDKSGVTRSGEHFKLTDGRFEDYYRFSLRTDEEKPGIDSILAATAENSGLNSDGDAIKVRFSKRMIHYTFSGPIAGGISGNASTAAAAVSDGNDTVSAFAAANNYFITISRNGTPIQSDVAWSTLTGGLAVYDTNDPTHKTVLLLPNSTDIYQPGDDVEVRVASTVLDPAGNSLDVNNDRAATNAS